MKNINILRFSFFIFVSLFFIGCEEDDPEVEKSAVYPLSGEWWVTYRMGDQDFGGYSVLMTYNSAANVSNEMILNGSFTNFVDGETNTLPYIVKVNSNPESRTFSASTVENLGGFNSDITVENGTIILDGGTSFSGVTTDSVYFELSFADPSVVGLDSGDKIIVSGVRRTGFPADDL